MTTFTPTAQQQAALDLFATGASMAIQAGAGTGKTATLKLLAESAPTRQGQYLAFNKAIVEEAKAKFPATVAANTAHSLAYRAEGHKYGKRLRSSGRMKSDEIARRLFIDPIEVTLEMGRKRLAPGFLAGHVMRAVRNFCMSADPVLTADHFAYIDGIDMPTPDGRRTFANNNEVRLALVPAAQKAWVDLSSTQGQLPFQHDHYLKLWQLSEPRIGADYIMLDEAQDTNPVLLDVVWRQADHAQLVIVGDSQQTIYEWRGCEDALAEFAARGAQTTYLSQSFRFGPAVAEVANDLLGRIDAELRLTGLDSIPSEVRPLRGGVDCVLTRTNAAAMRVVLEEIAAGRRPHLVGGGSELVSFARAALDLMQGRRTTHPELACFDNWAEVQDYVDNDQQGDELRLLVKLMDEYGPRRILDALERMPREADADLVVSTAHKSKGREWDRVQLGSDFPDDELREVGVPELRLLYVAVTRARLVLDTSLVALLNRKPEERPSVALPSFYADDDETEGAAPAVSPGMIGADGAAPADKPCPYCGATGVRDAEGVLRYDENHLGCIATPRSSDQQ